VRKYFTHGGKEMDREKKEKIAVFRFGVIFPLVEKDLHQYWGEKERILRELVSKEWEIPVLYPDIHQQSHHPGLGKTLRRWRAEDRGAVPRTPGRQGTDAQHLRMSRLMRLCSFVMSTPSCLPRGWSKSLRDHGVFPAGKEVSMASIYRLMKTPQSPAGQGRV
jgi:hypothetical protein